MRDRFKKEMEELEKQQLIRPLTPEELNALLYAKEREIN